MPIQVSIMATQSPSPPDVRACYGCFYYRGPILVSNKTAVWCRLHGPTADVDPRDGCESHKRCREPAGRPPHRPLSLTELHDICVRHPPMSDVHTLLWEIRRLHVQLVHVDHVVGRLLRTMPNDQELQRLRTRLWPEAILQAKHKIEYPPTPGPSLTRGQWAHDVWGSRIGIAAKSGGDTGKS